MPRLHEFCNLCSAPKTYDVQLGMKAALVNDLASQLTVLRIVFMQKSDIFCHKIDIYAKNV